MISVEQRFRLPFVLPSFNDIEAAARKRTRGGGNAYAEMKAELHRRRSSATSGGRACCRCCRSPPSTCATSGEEGRFWNVQPDWNCGPYPGYPRAVTPAAVARRIVFRVINPPLASDDAEENRAFDTQRVRRKVGAR